MGFAFVQSGLGWTALVFLCAHDMFYGWPYMNGPSCGIPSSFQYALYIPFLTILMKLPMVLPPLSTPWPGSGPAMSGQPSRRRLFEGILGDLYCFCLLWLVLGLVTKDVNLLINIFLNA